MKDIYIFLKHPAQFYSYYIFYVLYIPVHIYIARESGVGGLLWWLRR